MAPPGRLCCVAQEPIRIPIDMNHQSDSMPVGILFVNENEILQTVFYRKILHTN